MIELRKTIGLQIMQWSELFAHERRLLEFTIAARRYASAPYSHYTVGAAILWKDGEISSGCNIENSVYNVLHAEKCAIANGISGNGIRRIAKIAVRGGPETDERPLPVRDLPDDEFQYLASQVKFENVSFACGQCLQDIYEYSGGEPENVGLLICKNSGLAIRSTLADILPGRSMFTADKNIHRKQ
jgi:cytidine deaminase